MRGKLAQRFALGIGMLIAAAATMPIAERAMAQSGAEAKPLPEMALGPEDAPITIIEYSSASCAPCALFHAKTFPVLKRRYIDTGRVRFILRESPLNFEAVAISALARCQGGADEYFDFIALASKLIASDSFRKKYIKSKTMLVFKEVASKAGMDDDAVNQCFEDKELLEGLEASAQRAYDIGITTLPMLFVNGTQVPPPLKLADIERAIRNAR